MLALRSSVVRLALALVGSGRAADQHGQRALRLAAKESVGLFVCLHHVPCHVPCAAGDQCANLYRILTQRGWRVWYDNCAENLTAPGMKVPTDPEGVATEPYNRTLPTLP